MFVKKIVIGAAALACVTAATAAHAGRAGSFSSDTSAGGWVSYDWNGGNQGGTLQSVMQFAANYQGDFAGMDSRRNQVNLFLVDFAGSGGAFENAGLTLFVMWGNSNGVDGSFLADVDLSPPMTERSDGDFVAGQANIYALGAGVNIDTDGPVSVDVDVQNNETPVGFAISNIDQASGFGQQGIINMSFTLADAIRGMRLITGSNSKVWQGVDDDGDGSIFTDGLVLSVIPAPPAALWGVAGLAGVTVLGRRRSVRKTA